MKIVHAIKPINFFKGYFRNSKFNFPSKAYAYQLNEHNKT